MNATNALIVKYAGDYGTYYNMINQYVLEDTYPAGRAAISSADTLYSYKFSLIRNASAVTVAMTNQDGEVLYIGPAAGQTISAYYHPTTKTWNSTAAVYTMNKKVASLGVQEGDVITVTVYAIPEYYEHGEAFTQQEVERLIRSEELGKGTQLSFDLTVDDTAPELLDVQKSLIDGSLTVTARDNQYIAAIMIRNPSGDKIYASSAVKQTAPGPDHLHQAGSAGRGDWAEMPGAGGGLCRPGRPVHCGIRRRSAGYTGKMIGFTNANYLGSGDRWVCLDPETLYYYSSAKNEAWIPSARRILRCRLQNMWRAISMQRGRMAICMRFCPANGRARKRSATLARTEPSTIWPITVPTGSSMRWRIRIPSIPLTG